jgi:hypothetical protein
MPGRGFLNAGILEGVQPLLGTAVTAETGLP